MKLRFFHDSKIAILAASISLFLADMAICDESSFWLEGLEGLEDESENELGSVESPYDPIIDRLRSFETNSVTAADGDFLLSFVGRFDNFVLDRRLKQTAAAVYAYCGQFTKYREVRVSILKLPNFESAVLNPCPECSGNGEIADSTGGKVKCKKCRGAGWRVKDRVAAKKKLDEFAKFAANEAENSRNKLIQNKQAEEFARKQRSKGLVFYNNEWLTPAERTRKQRLDRFRAFVAARSKTGCQFKILQVIGNGRALCTDLKTGDTFCLLFPTDSANNRAIAEGDRYTNDLFWCGTFSYTSVLDAPKRVPLYEINIERALVEAIRQGFYED